MPAPERIALLMVDVQHGLFSGQRPVHRDQEVLAAIASLRDKAAEAAVPVVYVRDDEGPALWHPGEDGWRIEAAVAPRADEPVVDKERQDAFQGTALGEVLRGLGVTGLVLAGCMTQFSISSTLGRAVAEGYGVVLAGDAHSTWSTALGTAQQYIDAVNLAFNRFNIGRGASVVVPAAEIDFATLRDPAVGLGTR
jgi:nicotinamidase-related amidase